MRTGVLGGTFNPIHNAHLYLAHNCSERLALDRVLFIPTALPPHKNWDELIAPEQRVEMCRLALREQPGFSVCGYEVERGGKSYTADTLGWLAGQYPQDEFDLLLGGDMFLTVQEWNRAEQIFARARLCGIARNAGEKQQMEQHAAALARMGARCVVLDVAPLPLSSTQVRGMIRRGEDVRALLPPGVWTYIQREGLYGAQKENI